MTITPLFPKNDDYAVISQKTLRNTERFVQISIIEAARNPICVIGWYGVGMVRVCY